MVCDIVDYSVGVSVDSGKTFVVLCIHNKDTTTTLKMTEPCVVKLIQLLGATLEDYSVTIGYKGTKI